MPHSHDEVQAAFERYLAVRDGINGGNGAWADLAQFFTDDAVFIDPAWGRVEGIDEMKATVFGEALRANPDDAISRTYIERCRVLADDPPTEWNGIWVMTSK